mgnify:CR=1 FL=1
MGSPDQPLRQRFFRLAIPNILSNLTIPLAGLVDTAILGHLSVIHHLAGVALASVLFDYIYWTFGFLRMGTTGLTAQAAGRKSSVDLHLILVRGMIFAVALGFLLLLVREPLGDIGFKILSGEPDVIESGRSYYDARILAAPATLLNFVLLGWLLGRERSDYALVMAVVGNGGNIILGYLFILKWELGSYGAGLATSFSQYMMMAVGVVFVLRMTSFTEFKKVRHHLWEKEGMKALWTLNGDILIRSLALQTAFAFFLNFSSIFGTAILAANAIALKILSVASYFIDGFAFATESLAGAFFGEKNTKGLRRLLRLNCEWSLGVGLGFSILILIFPEAIYGLLTDHSEIIEQTSRFSFWLVGMLGFGAIAYALDGYCLGLTMGKALRVSMVQALFFGFFPLAMVGLYFKSPHILWSAMVVFMGVRMVTLGWRVRRTLE